MDKCPKEILDPARKIIPRNWHIIDLGEDMVFKPNAFNILLWVRSLIDFDSEENLSDDAVVGRVKGPINFYSISVWRKMSKMAKAAAKIYWDKRFGQIQMELDSFWLDISTFIHELAHVAVVRWRAQRLGKKYRDELGIVGQDFDGEPDHGPIFLKAYRRMIIRAEKVMGKEALKHNRAELKMFRGRLSRLGSLPKTRTLPAGREKP